MAMGHEKRAERLICEYRHAYAEWYRGQSATVPVALPDKATWAAYWARKIAEREVDYA
jgi:hypothetical protein